MSAIARSASLGRTETIEYRVGRVLGASDVPRDAREVADVGGRHVLIAMGIGGTERCGIRLRGNRCRRGAADGRRDSHAAGRPALGTP